jgi:hypothetical protein
MNCNTCRHLCRVKHEKNSAGFLYGRCASSSSNLDAHPYNHLMQDGIMAFHPDDLMGMPCYESRYLKTTDETINAAIKAGI